MKMSKLSHFDAKGAPRMVDVSPKSETSRVARARARVRMSKETWRLVRSGATKKGDVLSVARIAGIQAAKRTPELIPMCHPVRLVSVEMVVLAKKPGLVEVEATARAIDRTGVEMEALVAATTAALTVYDMAKSHDRWMTIEGIELVEKSGGKSGHVRRAGRR